MRKEKHLTIHWFRPVRVRATNTSEKMEPVQPLQCHQALGMRHILLDLRGGKRGGMFFNTTSGNISIGTPPTPLLSPQQNKLVMDSPGF